MKARSPARPHRRQPRRPKPSAPKGTAQQTAVLPLLLDRIPGIVWTTDAELRITGAGGAGLAGLDLTTGQLSGVALGNIGRTTDPSAPVSVAHRRALAGESVDYETDWNGRTFRGHLESLRDDAGRIVGVIGTAEDVTEQAGAREALRRSEERYRSLIENLNDIVFSTDSAGTLTYVSSAITLVSDYRPEEIAGQPFSRFVHPDDLPAVAASFVRTLEGHLEPAEFRVLDRQGQVHYVRTSSRPHLEAGRVVGITGVMSDVTDRKRAEAAQQEEAQVAAALARAGRELIAGLGTPRLLDRLCQVTAEVLGCESSYTLLWDPGDDAFVPIADFGATPEEHEAAQVIRVPRTMMALVLSRLERDDVAHVGTVPADLLSVPEQQRLGVTLTLCMALRRGSELIGVQVARSRHSRQPFTEVQDRIARGIAQVASLALEHDRVAKALDRANRLKSEFVATMSHELRTPLGVIIGYTDLLLEAAFGMLSPAQVDTVQKVQKSSRELLDLINATLDLSRLEAGRIPMDVANLRLADLIAEIDGETRGARERSGVSFLWKVTPDLDVRTDSAKLKLVLKNLIGNAIKFTDKGTVTLEAGPSSAGVEIAVTDTGIGITPEALPIIFEPFRQADVSTGRGGVGLGLYIVRRLLDALGASITVDSEVGRGSTFRVWLPSLT